MMCQGTVHIVSMNPIRRKKSSHQPQVINGQKIILRIPTGEEFQKEFVSGELSFTRAPRKAIRCAIN